MKTAIYIESGLIQLVLTPENEFEQATIGMFREMKDEKIGEVRPGTPLEAEMFRGTFYDCRGGWARQKDYYPNHYNPKSDDHSLIIRVKPVPEPVVAAPAEPPQAKDR